MSRVRYVDKRFYADKAALLPHAQRVIVSHVEAGFRLNPRGVAYRLEAGGTIIKTEQTFQTVETLVKDGREMGLIDWDHVAIDAQRDLHDYRTWNGTQDRLSDAANTHLLDKWADQPVRVEVWVEKEGLLGVIEGVCNELQVPYRTVTGYDGSRPKWEGARRIMSRTAFGRLVATIHDEGISLFDEDDPIAMPPEVVGRVLSIEPDDTDLGKLSRKLRRLLKKALKEHGPDQHTIILYIGDHDPSGLDLQRDIEDKLRLYGATTFEIVRVAVTCEETCEAEESDLHSNPAKVKDPRYPAYCEAHDTTEAWEVESIEPAVLAERLGEAIESYLDAAVWNEAVDEEERQREEIRRLADELDEEADEEAGA